MTGLSFSAISPCLIERESRGDDKNEKLREKKCEEGRVQEKTSGRERSLKGAALQNAPTFCT